MSTPTSAMQQQANANAYRYGNPMSVQSIPSSPAPSGPIHSPYPHQQQPTPTQQAPQYLNSSINSPIIQSPSMPQQPHHSMNLSMQSPIVQQSYSPMNNNSPMQQQQQQQQPPPVSTNSPYQQTSYPPSVNSPYNPYYQQQGHYHQPPTPIQAQQQQQQQMYMANSPFSGSGPPSYSHSGGGGMNTQPPTPGQMSSHPHHGMVASPYSNSQVPGPHQQQQQYSQPPTSSYPAPPHLSQQPPHLQHQLSNHHLNHMPHTPQQMGSVNSPMSLNRESSMYQQRNTPAPIDLELLEQQERERERERERREQERREQEQRQLEALKRQRKEKERERFLVELEFVQSLANPDYVVHLWREGVFERATFRNYLRYLLYWKEPEYIKFIKYPQCLFFLDLIAGSGTGLGSNAKSIDLEEHIYQVVNALRQHKSSIMDQQVRHWKSNTAATTTSTESSDTKVKSKGTKKANNF